MTKKLKLTPKQVATVRRIEELGYDPNIYLNADKHKKIAISCHLNSKKFQLKTFDPLYQFAQGYDVNQKDKA